MTLGEIMSAVVTKAIREGIALDKGDVHIELNFDGEDWAISRIETSLTPDGEIVVTIIS